VKTSEGIGLRVQTNEQLTLQDLGHWRVRVNVRPESPNVPKGRSPSRCKMLWGGTQWVQNTSTRQPRSGTHVV
jgi:hypothetical protein